MSDFAWLTAVEIADGVKKKKFSATEVTKASISRMEILDKELHAYCTPTPELALKDAKEIDKKISQNKDPGPLAGVPVGIKDLVCTKGIKTVSGSYFYKDFIPEEDDVSVERLKNAGAIVLGKTNAPEFGYSGVGHNPVFETTRNPWNTDLTPGGSSAGSCASVVTGVSPFAIASDGGGSIRIPSSLSGTYGMKASMGRVPLYPGCRDERYPGVSSWESIEHIGPVSNNVKDAALMLSVISGPDDRDRHSLPKSDFDWVKSVNTDIKGCKVGFSMDWGYAAVDKEVREIISNAAKIFEKDLGCEVVEDNPGWKNPYNDFWALVILESDLKGMRKLDADNPGKMSPHLSGLINRPWTAEDMTNATIGRKHVVNCMWKFMRKYDFLITPTLACPAFPIHTQGPEKIDGRMVDPFEWLHFTFPINMTGQPAASIPAGYTKKGLPVGLQIIGKHLDDPMVLRASAAFEKASPWLTKRPPILQKLSLK